MIFNVAVDFIRAVSGNLFRNKRLFGMHDTFIVCRLSASSAAKSEEPTLSELYSSTSEIHIVTMFVLLTSEIKNGVRAVKYF